MALTIDEFLHTERLPHIWCAGCGIGSVTGAFLRAVVDLGLKRENTVVVSGIGCSSRATGYLDLGTVHAIHGRALAFATGIKMARPEFDVVVFTGDGDGAAIGGNHLIHACRRNIDVTCILLNNQVYGMTGGQLSPTMDLGDRATTAPYGQVEPPFDLCRLAEAAGASFVARGTAAQIRPLQKMIKQGIEHPGFAFIEAVVPCPTEYGKRNPPAKVVDMLDDERSRSVSKTRAAQLSPEELVDKIVTGVLHRDTGAPEFQRAYAALAVRAQADGAAAAVGEGEASVEDEAREAPAQAGLPAARDFLEVRFGGSGGQGVILMGVILAMAGTRDHRYVVQTQSYGPEARGGYSRSDVIISDRPIDYPELERASVLVTLSQEAANEYVRLTRPDGILIYDSENVTEPPSFSGTSYGIPFTRLAVEETGRRQTANVLALGAVAGITSVVSVDSLRKAVMSMAPAGTERLNSKALDRGLALDPTEWRRSGA
jgi:2-oxoglutarate/2-oxoacid ferredoxin oxidoreductase subunit beta